MEIEQERPAVGNNDLCPSGWIDGGCAYSVIANHPQWREIAASADGNMIIRISPETRSVLLATAVSFLEKGLGKICGMIMAANDYEDADQFHYYSRVLWLIYGQTLNPLVKAKIALALNLAPREHIKILYGQEYAVMEAMKLKSLIKRWPTYPGYREVLNFASLCLGILEADSASWLVQQARKRNLFTGNVVRRAMRSFDLEPDFQPDRRTWSAVA